MSPTIKGLPARLVACCMASTAFAVAILTGLFAGNSIDNTLTRALAAMALCYLVGRLVGAAFEFVLRERLKAEENTGIAPRRAEPDFDDEPIDVSPVDEPVRARAA